MEDPTILLQATAAKLLLFFVALPLVLLLAGASLSGSLPAPHIAVACGFLAAAAMNSSWFLLARGRPLPIAVSAIAGTAIALYVGLCASLALTGTFRQLAVFASAGTLGVYLVSALGVLQLRRRGVTERENPFVVPGGPVIPVVAALFVVGLLSSLTGRELLATAGLAAAGLIVGAVRARHSKHPS